MKSRHKIRPETVKIIHFAVSGEEGTASGMGDDQKVYFWSYKDECWYLLGPTVIGEDQI